MTGNHGVITRFHEDATFGITSDIYKNLIVNKLCPVLSDHGSTPKVIRVFHREVGGMSGRFVRFVKMR